MSAYERLSQLVNNCDGASPSATPYFAAKSPHIVHAVARHATTRYLTELQLRSAVEAGMKLRTSHSVAPDPIPPKMHCPHLWESGVMQWEPGVMRWKPGGMLSEVKDLHPIPPALHYIEASRWAESEEADELLAQVADTPLLHHRNEEALPRKAWFTDVVSSCPSTSEYTRRIKACKTATFERAATSGRERSQIQSARRGSRPSGEISDGHLALKWPLPHEVAAVMYAPVNWRPRGSSARGVAAFETQDYRTRLSEEGWGDVDLSVRRERNPADGLHFPDPCLSEKIEQLQRSTFMWKLKERCLPRARLPVQPNLAEGEQRKDFQSGPDPPGQAAGAEGRAHEQHVLELHNPLSGHVNEDETMQVHSDAEIFRLPLTGKLAKELTHPITSGEADDLGAEAFQQAKLPTRSRSGGNKKKSAPAKSEESAAADALASPAINGTEESAPNPVRKKRKRPSTPAAEGGAEEGAPPLKHRKLGGAALIAHTRKLEAEARAAGE